MRDINRIDLSCSNLIFSMIRTDRLPIIERKITSVMIVKP